MSFKDKVGGLRRQKSTRLVVIILLMIVVGVIFYFWKAARIWMLGLFLLLLATFGLEVTGNDWDLGKLIQTGSFSESKVERTDGGTWLIGEECQKEKLNCDNFTYQGDAQDLFEKCGGLENDVHGLDGDNDGIVCESLPTFSRY